MRRLLPAMLLAAGVPLGPGGSPRNSCQRDAGMRFDGHHPAEADVIPAGAGIQTRRFLDGAETSEFPASRLRGNDGWGAGMTVGRE